MFAFRKMTPEDFPVILKWLAQPHVKKWWDDGDDTLEKVAAHYGKSDDTARFILCDDRKPIGYFQHYFADEQTIGIDQFIGDEKYTNRGVGTETIKLFIELIKQKYKPSCIVLDPSPENKRAIHCYEKIGFRRDEAVTADDANGIYLMRLELSE